MKILIPMSGEGSRFNRAGYADPKPLISVNGRPIIEHVVNLFPGETDFIFVTRQEHMETTNVEEVLKRIAPQGQIVAIPGSKKGPVWAAKAAFDLLDDNEPVIVNYCDFFMDWDYADFKRKVTSNQADGAIPCYLGFHPHLLHEKNFYASCLVDENNWMQEIREKHSYTPNKMDSPQSVGTYYFRSGAIVKKFFQMQIDEDVNLNGEYYVSLVYNLLQREGLKTWIYDRVAHFCQWGTPEDLEEYLYWSHVFDRYAAGAR